MSLLEFAFLFDQNWRRWTWPATCYRSWSSTGSAFTSIERSSNQIEQTLVMHVAGCGYDQVAIRKLASVKCNRCLVIKRGDCCLCPFDWPAERLIRKVSCIEELAE